MFENVRITKLQNGAYVAMSEMSGVNSCSVCFSMQMGSRRESLRKPGRVTLPSTWRSRVGQVSYQSDYRPGSQRDWRKYRSIYIIS